MPCRQPADGLARRRSAVLDRLGLVQGQPVPLRSGELLGVPDGGAVSGDHEVRLREPGGQLLTVQPAGTMVGVDPQGRSEAGGLPLPVADQ